MENRMGRWRKKLPFRELTIPIKMARGRMNNYGRKLTPFRELELEHGSLRMVDGVPLVRVRGTSREQGRALGTLVGVQAAETFNLYMRYFCPDFAGDLKLAREMESRMPQWFRDEMKGFSETSELTYDEVLLGQTFLDIHKVALCSTICAHDSATQTGEILMGRNLDFPSLDIADQANIVVVHEADPESQTRTFASVTWPGFLGCLTGLNEAGLALSMMLVYGHSRREHLNGLPFPLVFRTVMQNCATVAQAAQYLETKPYCTTTNLILGDAGRHGARFQLHPDHPVVEHTSAENPAIACTNHYLDRRIKAFAFTWFSSVWRLAKIQRRIRRQKFDVQGIKDALQATGIPMINIQRTIFRPERRELEVAFDDLGRGPGRWVRLPQELLFPQPQVAATATV
jgi:predicted choloylglycine hydrolase